MRLIILNECILVSIIEFKVFKVIEYIIYMLFCVIMIGKNNFVKN